MFSLCQLCGRETGRWIEVRGWHGATHSTAPLLAAASDISDWLWIMWQLSISNHLRMWNNTLDTFTGVPACNWNVWQKMVADFDMWIWWQNKILTTKTALVADFSTMRWFWRWTLLSLSHIVPQLKTLILIFSASLAIMIPVVLRVGVFELPIVTWRLRPRQTGATWL